MLWVYGVGWSMWVKIEMKPLKIEFHLKYFNLCWGEQWTKFLGHWHLCDHHYLKRQDILVLRLGHEDTNNPYNQHTISKRAGYSTRLLLWFRRFLYVSTAILLPPCRVHNTDTEHVPTRGTQYNHSIISDNAPLFFLDWMALGCGPAFCQHSETRPKNTRPLHLQFTVKSKTKKVCKQILLCSLRTGLCKYKPTFSVWG